MMLLTNGSLPLRLLGDQQKSTADQRRRGCGQDTAQQGRLLTACRTSPADRRLTRQHGSLG